MSNNQVVEFQDKSKLSQIVLVRHGATSWSESGRHTGRTDVELTPLGLAQASHLARKLTGYVFDAVFTSPLLRAKQTCALAGFADIAIVDNDLAEWDYGRFEGLTKTEIRVHNPNWDIFSNGADGGESLEQVSDRCDRFIDRLATSGECVAVFSHGHLLRSLAARWIGQSIEFGRHIALGTASISVLCDEDEVPMITSWNCETPSVII